MATILEFKEREGLKKKIRKYLDDPSLISKEGERAIVAISRAFKRAGADERKRMFLVLSTLAQDELAWILVSLLNDKEADDELKDQASIYLSVIGCFVSNPGLLTRRLNDIVRGGDRDSRLRAIVAMGWEGNTQAIPILVELLHSDDPEVQEVAVIGLSNLGDSRLFGILKDRLKGASSQQKRAIYYNLWRFAGKEDEALSIYKDALKKEPPGLRSDILTILVSMEDLDLSQREMVLHLLREGCLDSDGTVRLAAVKGLFELGALGLEEARQLVEDPNMEIKRIAVRLLDKGRE